MATAPSDTNPTTTNPEARQSSSEEWLLLRIGSLPRNSLGWFRCGVGFYNKKDYTKAIECFEKAVELDPMNVCGKSGFCFGRIGFDLEMFFL